MRALLTLDKNVALKPAVKEASIDEIETIVTAYRECLVEPASGASMDVAATTVVGLLCRNVAESELELFRSCGDIRDATLAACALALHVDLSHNQIVGRHFITLDKAGYVIVTKPDGEAYLKLRQAR